MLYIPRMRTLSIIATPIGNLEDITLRALRVLGEAHVVLCEDTRVTKKLLSHFGISTPTLSFHANSGAAKTKKIIELLTEGKHVALVTDAGTPGVSDPGSELVSVVRETFGEEARIEAIPGPSALAAALSISGLRASTFTFYGFLPHKKGRETLFRTIAEDANASVFYESPHRIMKALASLEKALPAGRRVGVYREITKLHEEGIVGTPKEAIGHFAEHPDRVRGEFVVIVEMR
jgi:16S rRNA (cytidine1402-2'-O)-methyltransferase